MKRLTDRQWKMKKVAEAKKLVISSLIGQNVGHLEKTALLGFMQSHGYEPVMVAIPGFSTSARTLAFKSGDEIIAVNREGLIEDVSKKARPAKAASEDSGPFNFSKWLKKQALYEGAQGYAVAQRRAWANCVKCKQDAGSGAQEAWDKCLDEFQKGGKDGKWAYDYASDVKDKMKITAQAYQAQMGEYWEKIQQKKLSGMTTAEAVNEVLKELEHRGRGIEVKP